MNETPLRRAMHIAGNVVGIALIAILLPIMIINTTLIVKSLTSPNDVPTVFGVAPLIVMSGSMHPHIQVNDLIFTREVDADTLEVGDVVAFQPLGTITVVTHRIIEVIEEEGRRRFVTAGDYTGVPDTAELFPHQVVGLFFHRVPSVGAAAEFLQQPIGMVLFVAAPLVLFLLYDFLKRYYYNKKKKQEDTSERDELERLRALAADLEAGVVPAPSPAAAPVPPAPLPAPAAPPAPAKKEYPPLEGEPEPPAPAAPPPAPEPAKQAAPESPDDDDDDFEDEDEA